MNNIKKIMTLSLGLVLSLSLTACGDNNSNDPTKTAELDKFIDNLKVLDANFDIVETINGESAFYQACNNVLYDIQEEDFQEFKSNNYYKYENYDDYYIKTKLNEPFIDLIIDPREIEYNEFDLENGKYILNNKFIRTEKYPFESLFININADNNECSMSIVKNNNDVNQEINISVINYRVSKIELPTNIGVNIYDEFKDKLNGFDITKGITEIIKLDNVKIYKANAEYSGTYPILVTVEKGKIRDVKFSSKYGTNPDKEKIVNSGFLDKFRGKSCNDNLGIVSVENVTGLEKLCDEIKKNIAGIGYADSKLLK